MNDIIERLQIPITQESEMPKGFDALTDPIRLDEETIIESIWCTLRSTEALVTLDGKHVQFWRLLSKREPPSRRYNGFVKTAP